MRSSVASLASAALLTAAGACSSFGVDPATSTVPDASTDAAGALDGTTAESGRDGGAVESLPAGLIARWEFEDPSGTIARDTGPEAKHHGALTSGAKLAVGQRGGGLEVDGAGGAVEIPWVDALAVTSFTVMMWVKLLDQPVTGTHTGDEQLFDYGTGFFVKLNGNSMKPQLSMSGRYALVGTGLETEVWHHLAVTYEPGKAQIYLDGVGRNFQENTFNNDPVLVPKSTTGLAIGCSNARMECARGSFDDVMLYNRALSADEVSGIFTR